MATSHLAARQANFAAHTRFLRGVLLSIAGLFAVVCSASAQAPTISMISPTSGGAAGGTSVTITGSNFTGATDVDFGAVAAAGFTVDNDGQITATSPAIGSSGSVSVTVTTPSGTSNGSTFTYDSPTISFISPSSGGAAGGTSVTITGSNFTGATDVDFDTTGASFTVDNDGQITATSPAMSSSGSVSITVTTPSGTSNGAVFTYDAPTLSGLSPNSGLSTGGESVTITGSGFTGATDVDFGAQGALFTVVNDGEITATTPAQAAGVVSVTVTTPAGTSGSLPFTYDGPLLTSLSPPNGPTGGGTSVTITGSDFTDATDVDFGSTAASFTVDNDTQITATAPAMGASTSVSVTVTTPVSTSNGLTFSYDAPTLTMISPNNGPDLGGTSVTISGASLTGATDVDFGAVAASGFTVDNDGQITATAPAQAAGAVSVTVTTPVNTSSGILYTYTEAPLLTGVSPDTGPETGGTSVTLTGGNFTGATDVDFGAVAATGFTVDNDGQITATAPAQAAGPVSVTVTRPQGTSAGQTFTYYAAPTLTLLSPNSGTAAGGTSVTLTGTDFTPATDVDFGGTAASFTVDNDGQITATSPPQGASGSVSVTVTNPAGTSTGLTYSYDGPTLSSIPVDIGSEAGGASVTLLGSDFTGATAVTFGAVAATGFTVDNDGQITATSPAQSPGPVSVTVTTPAGMSGGQTFTYIAMPAITLISPNNGGAAGGTSVTITGSNFTGATDVDFGAVAAAGFTVDNDGQITATSPPQASSGSVNVTVTTAGGTSNGETFTYASPTLSSLSPDNGPEAGGTSVTLLGSDFTGATAVTFGAAAATGFTVDNDGQITATSPPQAAGAVSVTVTTPAGTSGSQTFTYNAPAPLPLNSWPVLGAALIAGLVALVRVSRIAKKPA